MELAGNGEEALGAFEKSAVDLILVDLKVGQSDGCEVIRSTRHREAQCGRPRTRISALTVSVLAGDAERCLEMGMDGHLPKTVRKRISARRFLADR